MLRKELIIILMCLSLVFVGCGTNSKTDNENASANKESSENMAYEIEVNADNLMEYFEVYDYGYFVHDEFGDVTGYTEGKYLKLKDEYAEQIDPYASELSIKENLTYSLCDFSIDFEKETFEMGDYSLNEDDKYTNTDEVVDGGYLYPNDYSDDVVFFGARIACIIDRYQIENGSDSTGYYLLENYEITDVNGKLVMK
jgi:hypothetical protein